MAGQENRPGQSDGSGPKDIPSADELRQHLSDAIDEAEESLDLFIEDLDNDLLSDVTNRSELRKAREREVDPSLKKARILLRRYKSLVDESQSKQFEDQIANLITKIGNLNNRFPSEETGPDRIEPIRKLKEKIAEYSKALQDARDSGKHFDPRDDFNKEGLPLLNLALLKKKAVVWIPEKGADVAKLEEREQIIAEISKADDLVSEWMKEIAAIDAVRFAAWTIPIVPADIAEVDSLKGESETVLAAQTDVDLNASLTNLSALKKRIEKLLQDEPRKINPIFLDGIQAEYPGMDLDPLYTEQKKKYDVPLTQIKIETERRKAHLNTFTETQQRLAAEQAKQLIIDQWRVATQPLAEAIDNVINPVRPLGELFNSDWIVLRNALETAEKLVRVHLANRDDSPEINTLINRLKAEYSEALDRVIPILKVSPQESWRTFAWKENFIPRGSDPKEAVNWDAVEKGVINWILGYVTHEVWPNPLDPAKKGEIDTLGAPVDKSADKLAIRDVLYNHPDLERSKVVREQLEIMHHILEGGINWGGIIATPDHKKIMDHFDHFMFDGGTYHELSHMPALGNEHIQPGYTEPGFGETVFEGMSWYSYWNNRFIYATPAEQTAVDNNIEAFTRSGLIILPSESELRKVYAQIKSGDTTAELRLGSESELETRTTLRLFYVDSKQDHAKFIELFKAENRNRKIVKLESKRQVAFGVHPLREIGDEIRETGGVAERALNVKRKQLAIALGCYRLGLGNYTPDLTSLSRSVTPVTNKSGILVDRLTGLERRLTPDEEEMAFEAGQPAELFAFSGYICNGNQIVDDDVTAKSAVTAGRLTQTQKYRTGYSEIGREGFNMESVKMFKQILPTPWMYLGLNGKTMKALLADRHERVHAPYLNLGTGQSGAKRKFIELYDFSAKIYDALAYGMQNVEPSVNILDLATVERPKTFFSREEILKFKDKDIQGLVKYVEKVIGYYIDRLFVNTDDVDATGSIYPKNFWRKVPGTKFSSPLPGMMVNLPAETLETLKEETNRSGFKRAWVKVFLSPMIIESVLRSYSNEISLSDRLALGFVLAGTSTAPYGIRGAETEGSRLAVPDFSKTFGYSSEQVSEIIAAANLSMKSGLSVFFQEMGGV